MEERREKERESGKTRQEFNEKKKMFHFFAFPLLFFLFLFSFSQTGDYFEMECNIIHHDL